VLHDVTTSEMSTARGLPTLDIPGDAKAVEIGSPVRE
jgi:hypothetical protein